MAAFNRRALRFKDDVGAKVLVVFNRLPAGNLYFAADDCFAKRVKEKNALVRRLPRYRTYLQLEQQLFAPESSTRILFLNNSQRDDYLGEYNLPKSRYRVLPPGVRNDRRPGDNAAQLRSTVRKEFQVSDGENLLLFLGSDFRRKGLGRALLAMAHLPDKFKGIKLLVVGEDDGRPFLPEIESLGLSGQVIFAGARDDVPALLQGADLLIHPALHEAAGMVLVESLVAGLPILTTAACGYASYVTDSGAGQVVESPFEQRALDHLLAGMLGNGAEYRRKALDYAERVDLFGMHEQVLAEIQNFLSQ